MIGSFFVSDNWISDGMFATQVAKVYGDSPELKKMVESLNGSQRVDVALGQKAEYHELEVYEFDGLANMTIRCQRKYIDLITNGYPGEYTYAYVPAPYKVVCVFDEDGLVGFVARMKNEDEE